MRAERAVFSLSFRRSVSLSVCRYQPALVSYNGSMITIVWLTSSSTAYPFLLLRCRTSLFRSILFNVCQQSLVLVSIAAGSWAGRLVATYGPHGGWFASATHAPNVTDKRQITMFFRLYGSLKDECLMQDYSDCKLTYGCP